MPKPTRNDSPPTGIRRRRRSTAADPLRKMSLRLPESIASAIRQLVETGEAASADAFIQDALVAHFRARRQNRVYSGYAAAAADPAFIAEMEETDRAFDATVADGLRARKKK